ncbi:MAG: AbrB/MazE/SpoVT family DNA-binding domain-containing protein [Planctomycetaceae bacterium]
MDTELPQTDHCSHLRIDSSGRIRVPVEFREKLGVLNGDIIVMFADQDEVRLESAARALARAQEYFAGFVPADVSLVDDLVAERRDEAARE